MKSPFQIYQELNRLPFGRWLFMKLLCLRAPYFSTIRPRLTMYERGRCSILIKKRRAVQNHLGTVHAIAMCNMCELGAGLCLESVLPAEYRWIAKSMEIHYLKKAETDLVSTCVLAGISWKDRMDLPVEVDIKDAGGQSVVKATVNMYVSLRPRK